MNKLYWTAVGVVALAAATLSADAGADTSADGSLALGAKITLTCSYGASDAVRVYEVTNNQTKSIKAGTKIYVESTSNGPFPNDKRPASAVLAADLAPRRATQVEASGQTDAGTCDAYFAAGHPDLTIDSVTWTKKRSGSGKLVEGATVVVRNLNEWVKAGASKTRVQSMACTHRPVETKLTDTASIPGGETRTVFMLLSSFQPAVYLRAEANATGSMFEVRKDNNVREEGASACK
jgi:hypothetical protein